ncbi:MAG: PEP-CTERM/exosortase system-associated acyltransferase [Gammaproteobacteria bacterium]|nr:PEP-CTERM/exosortase system-associated acyltransferase [Gammaproteobacteria bacterium]
MLFDDQYEVFLCDTAASKRLNYSIRYKVYCLETGYERCEKFNEELEWDRYDYRSAHFVVRCKKTESWVAAMRLVLDAPTRMPIWAHSEVESPEYYGGLDQCAEISRACILSSHRRSQLRSEGVDSNNTNIVKVVPRRREPEILFGLLRAMYQYSVDVGVKHWFAMQSLPLARVARSLGFNLTEIGPEVDFRGIRKPYYCKVDDFVKDLETGRSQHSRLFNQSWYQSFLSRERVLDLANL